MTLRVRLTLFYTSLLGVVLILFGIGVYAQVSSILVKQIDQKLESAAYDTLQLLRVNTEGKFSLTSLISYDSSLTIQLWNSHGRIVDVAQAFNTIDPRVTAMDSEGLNTALENNQRSIHEVIVDEQVERVLTMPLETIQGDLAGAIQVGTDMGEINSLLQNLKRSLVLAGTFAIGITAIGGWLTTRRVLEPLSAVTRLASEITHADDLSRRIPEGKTEDEIGQLIRTFNQTLVRLEALFNLQKRFMADVGHELRTPLTVIKGNTEIMRREQVLDMHLLDVIEKETDRLSRLLGDLLLLAQAEAGKLPMASQLVELDTLMLETLQEVHYLVDGRKKIQIDDIDQVLVQGDRDRLKQVLLNLVSNAVNYTQDGGEIRMNLCKQGNMACFSVQDNGPGIPAEDLEHIFERFYRGEKSRSRSGENKGYGLGLSIAYWIVNNHGGRIEVESEVGRGTKFEVFLPLV
jgi:two-component system OmpR family sensor kinase